MDHETKQDIAGLEKYEKRLEELGYVAKHKIGFGNPPLEIAEIVKSQEIDFLVMGAHGHKGVKDLIFGTTLDLVRHKINVPILIVK